MAHLIHNSYGKSSVRLTKVSRRPDRHDLQEITIDVELEGEFDDAYTHGDNRRIIATDTMKNTVYALARHHPLGDLEDFGLHLAAHFVQEFEQVRQASIRLAARSWNRIDTDGSPHPTAFVGGSAEQRICTVMQHGAGTEVRSGLQDLLILKTTRSSFSGFARDRYTTLRDTDDRILATNVTALWRYERSDHDWSACHHDIRRSMLRTFAEHDSRSVQETLYKMGEAALEACPHISEITLDLPNSHRLLVDLEPFDLDNPNVIFVPSPEPFGVISGTLKRT